MNPEFLSDGLLYESKDEWQKAFAKDGEKAARLLSNKQEEFSSACQTLCDSVDASRPGALIDSFQGEFKNFLDRLSWSGSLFPSEAERRALLPAVLKLLSSLEERSTELWRLLESLSATQAELETLLGAGEALKASLFPAAAASVGLSLSPDPSAALSTCLQSIETLHRCKEQISAYKKALDQIYQFVFFRLVKEVAKAADIEQDGAGASSATLYRLVGNAGQTLSLIASKIPAAFRF